MWSYIIFRSISFKIYPGKKVFTKLTFRVVHIRWFIGIGCFCINFRYYDHIRFFFIRFQRIPFIITKTSTPPPLISKDFPLLDLPIERILKTVPVTFTCMLPVYTLKTFLLASFATSKYPHPLIDIPLLLPRWQRILEQNLNSKEQSKLSAGKRILSVNLTVLLFCLYTSSLSWLI